MEFVESVPDVLRGSVARWWERACADTAFLDRYRELSAEHRAQLPRVVAASEFAAQALIQDPAALAPGAVNTHFEAQVAAAQSVEQALLFLRQWRRREMVRIAWRDIAGRVHRYRNSAGGVRSGRCAIRAAVAAPIASVADIRRAARSTREEVAAASYSGMGKLGGRELNFSSDIDLVFLFSEAGARPDGPREVDNEEYFNRARPRAHPLAGCAKRGRLRVSRGHAPAAVRRERPLGRQLGSLEDYLQQHGRDWERYAWIKARAIVGADAYAPAYEEFVRPFVYRRYLDFGVFESLRNMKALIVARGGPPRTGTSPETRQGRYPRNRVHRAIHAAGARRKRSAPAERGSA